MADPSYPLTVIAETDDRFDELGRFPSVNSYGAVAFNAVLRDGQSGVFRAEGGKIIGLLDTNGPFESFRGALINS